MSLLSNDNALPDPEEIKKVLEEHTGMKVEMNECEVFATFILCGNIMHSLTYIDDPIFLYANSRVMQADESDEEIVKKIPATLTGYILLNKNNKPMGFTCFDSQVKTEE